MLFLAPQAGAVYPGSNGRIAFTSAQGVAVVDSDGQFEQQLQPGGDPSWSPTGSNIAYECVEGGVQQICEMAPDGSESTSLTVDGGADPEYTPGADIVFVREVAGFDQVFTMNDEGGEIGLQQQTSDARDHEDPTYSDVGQPNDGDEQIAYAADGDIWTMGIGEDNATNLTNRFSLGSASHPDFAPDGTRIVFSAGDKIYSINPDGTGIRQLTDGSEGQDRSPVFSPAGDAVAFSRTSPSGDSRVIALAGPAETAVTPAQPGVADATPSWQPIVPDLLAVQEEFNQYVSQCPADSVLVGGGHTGIRMLQGPGDGEAPTANGSWQVSATQNNDDQLPVATYATCGSPTYWQSGSGIQLSTQVIVCGARYLTPRICTQTGDDSNTYIEDVYVDASCGSNAGMLAGGFLADAEGETTAVGSTLAGPGDWNGHARAAALDARGTFQTVALCLNNPNLDPAIVRAATTEGPIEGDAYWTWYAECPDGSAALAGGWDRTDFSFGDDFYTLNDNYPTNFQQTDYGTLPTSIIFRLETDGPADPSDMAVTATCAVLPSGLEQPESNGSLTFVKGGKAGDVLSTASGATPLTDGGRSVDSEPQWLPDASGFVFARTRGGRPPELRLYSDAYDSVSRLTDRPLKGSAASYAPDLRSFAYARGTRRGGAGIVLVSETGLPDRQLTSGRFDRAPAFSPAGETIAFSRGRGASSAIWTVDEEGEVRSRLTPRGLAASDPDWSPDGTRVLFTGRRSDCASVYSIPVDGGDPERLTGCGTSDPAFSPNGERIAYVARTAAGSAVVTAGADGGGGGERMVERSRGRVRDPDWRPYPGRSGPRE